MKANLIKLIGAVVVFGLCVMIDSFQKEGSDAKAFWGVAMVGTGMISLAGVIQAAKNIYIDYSRSRDYKRLCVAISGFHHSYDAEKFAASIGQGLKWTDLFNENRNKLIRSNLAKGRIGGMEVAVYDTGYVESYGGGGKRFGHVPSEISRSTEIWIKMDGSAGWIHAHSG